MTKEGAIKSISKYFEAVDAATKEAGVYVYRGQSDEAWPLRSSAARRILATLGEKNEDKVDKFDCFFLRYHENDLIEPAKMNGYHREDRRELKDLEVLAKLQHHGAATCLMDFTKNPLFALWFACLDDTKDGAVFIINSNNPSKIRNLIHDDLKSPFKKILAFKTREKDEKENPSDRPLLWRWKPEGFDPRILWQDSVFLFGQPSVPEELIKLKISIDKDAKKDILKKLKSTHNINAESLFKDLSGFAGVNAYHSPLVVVLQDAEQYFIRGNNHFQQGQYEEAIKVYDEVIRLDSKYAPAYYNRGTTKGELGQHEAAIKDFDKAIELNPKDAVAYNNRGTAKSKLGQHVEAIKDYDEAIELNPEYAKAYYNRGNAKGDLGQHEEAIKDFDEAIRLNPNDAVAYNNRGNAKNRLGQHEEAIKDYDEAIELNPEYAKAYCNRGNTKGYLGQHEAAIKDFDKAIELNPNDTNAYYNRGIAKLKMDRNEAAIKDFDKAIRLNPNDASAYYNRGNAKSALGRREEAIKDYNEAIRLNPKDANAYNNRGLDKQKLGRNEEAEKDFEKARQLTEEKNK